jgi:hypothetical protein
MHFLNGTCIFDQPVKTRFENIYWKQALADEDVRGEALQFTITAQS